MQNELDRTITLRDRSRNDRFKNGKHAGHMRIQEKERESGFGGVTVGVEIDRDRRSKVTDQEEDVEERSGQHVSSLPSVASRLPPTPSFPFLYARAAVVDQGVRFSCLSPGRAEEK
ncbi:hypothetical protein BHE74_00040778 [Ensete ventricosum]|nr:hypothetical protein GW17_00055775 [Ensete ventricosum]RWW52787.1 hypothetical protein BHE74_00040778 [Ensete ventricosum]RZS21375.1 hypothetical protein BHM03_00054007 [Ensete ventricosum]